MSRMAITAARETKKETSWISNVCERKKGKSSVLYSESSSITVCPDYSTNKWPRVAVILGNPVDVTISWSQCCEDASIPVVNMANEKSAGGNWQSGLVAPEECLARRSNLVAALTDLWCADIQAYYPIPHKGGIYSPEICTHGDLALSLDRMLTIVSRCLPEWA